MMMMTTTIITMMTTTRIVQTDLTGTGVRLGSNPRRCGRLEHVRRMEERAPGRVIEVRHVRIRV